MDFDSMKYAELQAYAKASGLKANMKDNAETVPPQDEKDTAFVNKRRGHGKGKKRKMSDTVSEDTTDTAQDQWEKSLGYRKASPSHQVSSFSFSFLCSTFLFIYLDFNSISFTDFKKLHEAQFQKMESIDSYFQRRNKQLESCNNSAKEVKVLLSSYFDLEIQITHKPNPARTSLFSPAPSKKAAEDPRRHTLLSASKAPPKKPARKEEVPFRPSVLSTRRINVRFSEATADNEHKTSLIKTPARMSLCMASSTPQRPAAEAAKPTKTPSPFLFTGNTSMSTTPGTQKKQSFDLKASLSRPLTYKPHAGKLKPFAEVKEKPALNKSLTSNPRQDSYKQHKVQTRSVEARTKTMEGRKQKKDGLLGARRGLVMM
uniref:Nucleolar and spindle associated protein 1 n=1 Tax=Salarias fasciatus TaxID=181472 RepID=A0A672JM31_SALFA